ncbi:MAG TPA: GNAT family N-acetyltransferase [Thermoanaerobaculia bacterium]|nr:GNAT family N-acetyltransferase [Thermoanaerobaculia bacterium]
MIRTATREDLPALRTLFARANDAPYPLDAVAEEKCFGEGIAGEPVVRVFGDFEGAAVTCGKWLRILIVDRPARRRGIGSALLEDANAQVIAAEPGNYFLPGVLPHDVPFFTKRGYVEKARTWNLHVNLPPAARRPLPASPHVFDFIEQTFGKIWRFESARASGIVTREENGEITGFAAYEANNRGLGTFGPTGVTPSMRGRGLGRELLLDALAALRELGYERAVIPWTDALEFYRKSCGAEPAHEFVALVSVP